MEEENAALSGSGDSPSSDMNGADTSGTAPVEISDPSEATEDALSEQGDDEDADDEGDHEESVPYDRFREVNTKYRATEKELAAARARQKDLDEYGDVIEQIKALGGKTALQQAMAETQQAQREQAAAARQAQIEAEAAEMVESGDMSDAAAQRWIEVQVKLDSLAPLAQDMESRQQEDQIIAGVAQLKSRYPDMNEKYVRLAMEVGDDPVLAARESHEEKAAIREAAVSQYTTKRKEATEGIPPTPGGTGAGPQTKASKIPDPVKDPEAFGKYLDKIKGNF